MGAAHRGAAALREGRPAEAASASEEDTVRAGQWPCVPTPYRYRVPGEATELTQQELLNGSWDSLRRLDENPDLRYLSGGRPNTR